MYIYTLYVHTWCIWRFIPRFCGYLGVSVHLIWRVKTLIIPQRTWNNNQSVCSVWRLLFLKEKGIVQCSDRRYSISQGIHSKKASSLIREASVFLGSPGLGTKLMRSLLFLKPQRPCFRGKKINKKSYMSWLRITTRKMGDDISQIWSSVTDDVTQMNSKGRKSKYVSTWNILVC